jgi:hypothetical protein
VFWAQIMILWSPTLLTWWWLRWLPFHFPPDLSKSSVVVTRIFVFENIQPVPQWLWITTTLFNSYIGCARCMIYKRLALERVNSGPLDHAWLANLILFSVFCFNCVIGCEYVVPLT